MTYFQIHSFSQAIESFEKIETKIEGGFINKNIRGKLIKHILL